MILKLSLRNFIPLELNIMVNLILNLNQPTQIIDSEDFEREAKNDGEIIDAWTEKLKNEINNHPHHPNSAIYGNSKYLSQIDEIYDGEPTRFLNEKDSKKWLSMDNLISSVPLKKNYWFNGGGVGIEQGRLGRFREWGDKFSSEDIIRGMIKTKLKEEIWMVIIIMSQN